MPPATATIEGLTNDAALRETTARFSSGAASGMVHFLSTSVNDEYVTKQTQPSFTSFSCQQLFLGGENIHNLFYFEITFFLVDVGSFYSSHLKKHHTECSSQKLLHFHTFVSSRSICARYLMHCSLDPRAKNPQSEEPWITFQKSQAGTTPKHPQSEKRVGKPLKINEYVCNVQIVIFIRKQPQKKSFRICSSYLPTFCGRIWVSVVGFRNLVRRGMKMKWPCHADIVDHRVLPGLFPCLSVWKWPPV